MNLHFTSWRKQHLPPVSEHSYTFRMLFWQMIPILLTHTSFKSASNCLSSHSHQYFSTQDWREVLSEDNVHKCLKALVFFLDDYAAADEKCVFVCVWRARVCGLWIDWVHLHILSSCPLNRMAGRALEWASEGTLESPLRPHLRICYTNMLIGMLIQLVITRTWVYCSMSAFEVEKLGNCLHIKCATELV